MDSRALVVRRYLASRIRPDGIFVPRRAREVAIRATINSLLLQLAMCVKAQMPLGVRVLKADCQVYRLASASDTNSRDSRPSVRGHDALSSLSLPPSPTISLSPRRRLRKIPNTSSE